MTMGNKKYFAFISYSHKDSELAKWLQHEFEYYELPAKLFEERKDLRKEDLPESFRPVFRDEDELSGGELKPQISDALADSEYLIVVCSPNSAQSPYVDSEIREFISLSQENKRRIFPFIVDGKPHQDDDNNEKECFPQTLLELSEDKTDPVELIAGDIHATGRDHAFVKILAGTLNEKDIRFADLWDRYAIEKAEQERKEREDKEKLQIMQSRFLAEKANQLVDEGDSYTARLLALEALPKDLNNPSRPYVLEAERALRRSNANNNIKLYGHMEKVFNVCFSSDGHKLLSQSTDSFIVWDLESGVILRIIKGCFGGSSFYKDGEKFITLPLLTKFSKNRVLAELNDACIWAVENNKRKRIKFSNPINHFVVNSIRSYIAFSKDKNHMVFSYGDTLVTYNLITLSISKTIKIKTDKYLCSLSISPDGKRVSTAYRDHHIYDIETPYNGEVDIWDINTGEVCSQLRGGHTDRISAICFSHDGKYIITASWDNSLIIWNSNTGEEIRTLKEHHERVLSVDISPDGKKIVSGSKDCSLLLWSFFTGEVINKLSTCDSVQSVTFSPDGKNIAYTLNDNVIRIWDSMDCNGVIEHDFSLFCQLAMSNRGNVLALTILNCILLLDIKTLIIKKYIIGHSEQVRSVAFNPDGSQLVSVFYDGKMIVWDIVSGEEIYNYHEVSDSICSVVYSPDGKYLITNSEKGTLKKWDETGNVLWSISDATSIVAIDYSPNGTQFVSVDKTHSMVIRDAISGKVLQSRHLDKVDLISPLAFSPDGDEIVYFDDAFMYRWNTITGVIIKSPNRAGNGESSIEYSSSHSVIMSVDFGNGVKIWDAKTLSLIKSIEIDEISCACFTDNGNRIISSSIEGVVNIRNLKKGNITNNLKISPEVSFVSISPNGKEFATICDDGYPIGIVRNTNTNEIIRLLIGHKKSLKSITYSLDGKKIATSSQDGTIIIWDTLTGGIIQEFYHDNFIPQNVAFSPQGGRFVVISVSNTGEKYLGLYDIYEKKELYSRGISGKSENSIDFSSDGNKLVIIDGQNLRILNAETGELLKTLNIQYLKTIIKTAKFSIDGTKIVSIAENNNVIILNAETGLETSRLKNNGSNNISISPFGQYVAADFADYTLKVLSLETGIPVHSYKLKDKDQRVRLIAFSLYGILFADQIRTYFWDFPPLQELINRTRERYKDRTLTDEEKKRYYLE